MQYKTSTTEVSSFSLFVLAYVGFAHWYYKYMFLDDDMEHSTPLSNRVFHFVPFVSDDMGQRATPSHFSTPPFTQLHTFQRIQTPSNSGIRISPCSGCETRKPRTAMETPLMITKTWHKRKEYHRKKKQIKSYIGCPPL